MPASPRRGTPAKVCAAAASLWLVLACAGCTTSGPVTMVTDRGIDLGYTCWEAVPPDDHVVTWVNCQNARRDNLSIVVFVNAHWARLPSVGSGACARASNDNWVVAGDSYADVETMTRGLRSMLEVPVSAPSTCQAT